MSSSVTKTTGAKSQRLKRSPLTSSRTRLPARRRLKLAIDLLYGNEGLLPLDTFARFSQNPAYHTQLSQPIETVMLALNTAKAPTNELAVREALNYAVNKKSLIDNASVWHPAGRRHPVCPFCALRQPRPETAPVRSAKSESVAGKSRLDAACGQRHPRETVSRCALNFRSSAPMR